MLLLIAALLQGGGRLGMWLLHDFEGAIDAYFGDQVSLTGLRGSWDGLNPVVLLQRVEAPAGWAEQVLIELDWLETLRRNRLIMQRISLERGMLNLVRSDAGWAIAGTGEQTPNLDWAGLLAYTDEIRLRGRLRVTEAPGSELDMELLALNRDGLHGFDLALSQPSCVQDCTLRLHWRSYPNRLSFRPAERHLLIAGALSLPPAYLPWTGLAAHVRLQLGGQWAQRGAAGGGAFDAVLALEPQESASGEGGGARASLSAQVASFTDAHTAIVTNGALSNAAGVLPLDRIVARHGGRGLDLWAQALSLDTLADVLAAALPDSAMAQWLRGMDPGGTLRNLRFGLHPTGPAFAATLDGLSLAPYRGVPLLRHGQGSLFGYERGLLLALNSDALEIHFADTFPESWRLRHVQAHIHGWFTDGYLGLRSPTFRAQLPEGPLAGAFALARPADPMRQRLSLLANADRLTVNQAKPFIPITLSEDLQQWLHEAPRQGLLAELRMAYQGQVHTEPQDFSRRAAMKSQLSGAEVAYHRDWPALQQVGGQVEVSGENIFAKVDAAASLDVAFRDSHIHLGGNGAFAAIHMQAAADAGAALNYIRTSPIWEWMDFVQPQWDGAGQLGLAGKLFIPLNEQQVDAPFDADLDIDLRGLSLDLPNYRLRLDGLSGQATYRFPYALNSDALAATLFGRAAALRAIAQQDAMHFLIDGVAAPKDVYHLADMTDFGLASGAFPFDATFTIPLDGDAPRLSVRADLQGLALHLPGAFGKTAQTPRATEVDLLFQEQYSLLQLHHGAVQGWLHVDDAPLRGAFGVHRPPPTLDADADEVLISGGLARLDVQEWVRNDEGLEFPLPWRLREMRLDEVVIEETSFAAVTVTGGYRDGVMALGFAGEDIIGELRSPDEGLLAVHLDRLRLPAEDEEDSADPLDVAIIDRLPEAAVSIDSVHVGDEDFGRWSFIMRPQAEGLLLEELKGELKGISITAEENLLWRRDADRSEAAAKVTMKDLQGVLPQWDYAPSLSSESAELRLSGSWPGSPLNFYSETLTGRVSFKARNGQFLDVDSGAGTARLFSLLNFTTIAKRMNFNFKDLTGKGISFDTIKAETRLDNGLLTFLEPAKMKGSGADFKLAGSVDLVAGAMNNNEMIVTLPVSDSLPWYAVYVSLANPVAGLAVLAGQQALKNQIKQFSSAKYEVSGPWEDPEVKLVGIWNDDLQSFDELADQQPPAKEGG